MGATLSVIVAVLVVVAGSAYLMHAMRAPLTASGLSAVVPAVSSATPVPTETVFAQPRLVNFEGVVFGVLAGGRGLAVRRYDGQQVQLYAVGSASFTITGGPVHVIGAWSGISCAYANTVFNGLCTPIIDVTSIEQLPVAPW